MEMISCADPALAERCQAIAERERQEGWASYAALDAEMTWLLDLPAGGDLRARLAAEIRRGALDDNAQVESWLWRHVCLRLRENYPEFMIDISLIPGLDNLIYKMERDV